MCSFYCTSPSQFTRQFGHISDPTMMPCFTDLLLIRPSSDLPRVPFYQGPRSDGYIARFWPRILYNILPYASISGMVYKYVCCQDSIPVFEHHDRLRPGNISHQEARSQYPALSVLSHPPSPAVVPPPRHHRNPSILPAAPPFLPGYCSRY